MHSKSTSMSVIYTFWTATPGAKPSEGTKEFHKPLNERRPMTPNCRPFEKEGKRKGKKRKTEEKEEDRKNKSAALAVSWMIHLIVHVNHSFHQQSTR